MCTNLPVVMFATSRLRESARRLPLSRYLHRLESASQCDAAVAAVGNFAPADAPTTAYQLIFCISTAESVLGEGSSGVNNCDSFAPPVQPAQALREWRMSPAFRSNRKLFK